MNIVLIGFKASGKSTIGAALARQLRQPLIDTDVRLEDLYAACFGRRLGTRAIYQTVGQARFRALEKVAVASIVWTRGVVVATGGGTLESAQNVRLLKRGGVCVFLDAPLKLILQRMGGDRRRAPIFQDRTAAALYKKRRPIYLRAADVVLPITGKTTPTAAARAIVQLIEQHHGQ